MISFPSPTLSSCSSSPFISAAFLTRTIFVARCRKASEMSSNRWRLGEKGMMRNSLTMRGPERKRDSQGTTKAISGTFPTVALRVRCQSCMANASRNTYKNCLTHSPNESSPSSAKLPKEYPNNVSPEISNTVLTINVLMSSSSPCLPMTSRSCPGIGIW